MITVRAARREDGPAQQAIERLAGEQFRVVGLDSVADDEPASFEELADYATDGRSWVAVDAEDRPIGYVVVDEVDGNAHVEQVSVQPDYQHSGVGRALLDRVRLWALETERPAITLTTFADVSWNRPLYEHLGFRVLAEDEITPELRDLRAAEATHGLDPTIRVCMRLDLNFDAADKPDP